MSLIESTLLCSNPSECYIFNLFRFVLSFFAKPGEALEGPFSTGVSKNSTMLIQLTTYKYENLQCYIYIHHLHLYVCMHKVVKMTPYSNVEVKTINN